MELGFSIKTEDSEPPPHASRRLYPPNSETTLTSILAAAALPSALHHHHLPEREKLRAALLLPSFALLCCSFESSADFVAVCLFLPSVGRSSRGKLEKHVVELYDGGELVLPDLFALLCL